MIKDRDEAEVLVHDSDGRVCGSLFFRGFTVLHELGQAMLDLDVVTSHPDDGDEVENAALRAEAVRLTPSYARLKAGIARRLAGQGPQIEGDFENEEMPY
jgi:hypothetical protein